MSMATYIGLNFPVEINDDYTEDEVEINYVFSDQENRQAVQQKHFSTPYIYEIATKGAPIWDMHDENKMYSPHNYEKSKRTFLHVFDFLKDLLAKGDYCEIYICWVGEEEDNCENKFELTLNESPVNEIEIYEKCLITMKR
ncbi:hypothetical protein [Lysinibacillus sp. ZYM-1]|uniref:hypothetical protein n=1 Tax=Lysinibacillus sp. ZYM-1 TaxID=1681184 RepID=UPI0006CEA6BD|nr:hypothetical protein [Lysinibacillus sp. ZYM-1]KPN94733.1 hypothetical protein AO843_04330 [Lysinibacillus sp. ZYM-1]